MTSFATETFVATPDAVKMMDAFMSHVEEDHDLTPQTDADGGRFVESNGYRMCMSVAGMGLRIQLSGPEEQMMLFMKEAVATHLASFDKDLAKSLRWTGETAIAGTLPESFNLLTLVHRSEPMPGLVRATVTAEDDRVFASDAIHLRMMLPCNIGRVPVWPSMAANGSPVWPQGDDRLHMRAITIRHARPEMRELDLDVVSHGEGLISGWASGAKIGAQIGAMGPLGDKALPEVSDYLLIADQTGLPAVARHLETVPDGATGYVICEAESDDVLRGYLPKTRFELKAIPSASFSDDMRAHVQTVLRPGVTGHAVFLGEFDDAQALRKVFKGTLGLGKGEQISASYWRRGQTGFEG
ncbi:MAG: siderophore-interacting protein [Pseudomonadota bacterium]